MVLSVNGKNSLVKVQYRRVDHRATPTNENQRKEIVKLRDVDKLSWRAIAKRLGISFQRVCQIYDKVKEQAGVEKVKNKEVLSRIKTGRGRAKAVKTRELTPDAIDRLIDLDDKKPTLVISEKKNK